MFHPGLERAADAYGRNGPSAFGRVAGLLETIFFAKSAPFLVFWV